ncbi:MAG: C25 family cysteine peptidase, partial [Bacteroidales bacterium]|nr:C25 family cysteine peptidase [Bacteroidales bacterium]
MKKILFLLIFIAFSFSGYSSQWITISSQTSSPSKAQLVSSTIDHSVIHVTLDGFSLTDVLTPKGLANVVTIGKATPILELGAPDLPKIATSLIIPDLAKMSTRIIASSYKDFENIEVAPSKGVIMRDQDPATVPFQYGKFYEANEFYPGSLTDTREPFILRDFRGQTVIVYPFQYNPVTKTLRVYYDLTIELYKSGETGLNPLLRKSNDRKVQPEFRSLYVNQFLNSEFTDYIPTEEYGRILVLCHGPFMDSIQPYVKWKRSIGYPTDLVDIATVGTSASVIKTYIADYYNENDDLAFVLLVGDAAQIPTYQGSGVGGPSDNAYGYIVGNDHYADVFIGRFSAENSSQVKTQVKRTVAYESNPAWRTDDWYTTVIGVASDLGPGDDNEDDYEHIRNQQLKLLDYTYTMNPEFFDGSQGGNDAPGNPSASQVGTSVNEGSSLMLYCGHGGPTSWTSSGFSNSSVNALTNQGKLPFIWSVACENGKFMNTTCFAEAWLRASKNNEPTGAIAFLGSTINQSWDSPMAGQDEMTDILVETYPSNIKRTFAGISINGCMKMIEQYGTDGKNMADTWTVFGDPSVMVRTANPDSMLVAHDTLFMVGDTSLSVLCNIPGARVTLTLNDSILATELIPDSVCTLIFPAL